MVTTGIGRTIDSPRARNHIHGHCQGDVQGVYVCVCVCVCDMLVLQDVDKSLWDGAESNVKLHLYKLLAEEKVAKTELEDGTVRWKLSLSKL